MKESNVHYQVAQYLKIQYPNVIFRTDFAAGIRMTMGQAMKHKGLQSGRAYPDIFIAEPRPREGALLLVDTAAFTDDMILEDFLKEYVKQGRFLVSKESPNPIQVIQYHGLYIELKREGTVLTRPKDARAILKGETKLRLAGDWFDDHVEEQALMLERLRKLGYKAEFAIGFEQAKMIIDNYLK